MTRIDFTEISRRYEQESVAQRAAAEVLLELLQIGPKEDVLDLGCATGHLARRIASITSGRVTGLDPSPGMIAQARANIVDQRVSFHVAGAENLQASGEFDAIFCNSAFQWFRDPAKALEACRRALRAGGRMAIQAPARQDYCPVFLQGVDEVARHPATAGTFAKFRSPWFFLENAEAYSDVFQRAGFLVPFARMEHPRTRCSPEQVLKVFESGAAAAYLNPDCYEVPFPQGYVQSFRQVLAGAFDAQADADGKVELVIHRVYLLAVKPG
jgi:ubiquinone/menaquinone biosynthesis C-methylase UbiE